MLFISTGIFDDKLRPQILSVGTIANAPPQTSARPYIISVEPMSYSSGTTVTGKISIIQIEIL
jgi:hypothetical protein